MLDMYLTYQTSSYIPYAYYQLGPSIEFPNKFHRHAIQCAINITIIISLKKPSNPTTPSVNLKYSAILLKIILNLATLSNLKALKNLKIFNNFDNL